MSKLDLKAMMKHGDEICAELNVKEFLVEVDGEHILCGIHPDWSDHPLREALENQRRVWRLT